MKETIKTFVALTIGSWNPENFADLLDLLDLQYSKLMPEIKAELGIVDSLPLPEHNKELDKS